MAKSRQFCTVCFCSCFKKYRMHSYRIISAWCTARREQEISQTVRYKFVSLDTVWLQHVGM